MKALSPFESIACKTVKILNPTPEQQKLLGEGWTRYHRADGKKGWYKPAYRDKVEPSKQEAANG